jgi:predicted lysophospholipase L1 biosynthesis ABC-type transport system permease subunit
VIGSAVLTTRLPPEVADAEPWFVETSMFTTRDPEKVAGPLRAVAAEIDPLAQLTSTNPKPDRYGTLRTALDLGSVLILLMMGAGLLLDVTARLHERRRVLGVLSAVGARRSTVVWSVLLQVLAPVSAGLALAAAVGTGVGALLMRMSELPAHFTAAPILSPVVAGAALMVATTAVILLPTARRATRTEVLRSA